MKAIATLVAAVAAALAVALPASADTYRPGDYYNHVRPHAHGSKDTLAKRPAGSSWSAFRPQAGWCIENPCFN